MFGNEALGDEAGQKFDEEVKLAKSMNQPPNFDAF